MQTPALQNMYKPKFVGPKQGFLAYQHNIVQHKKWNFFQEYVWLNPGKFLFIYVPTIIVNIVSFQIYF